MKTIGQEGHTLSEKRQLLDHWTECVTLTSDWQKSQKIMHDPKLKISAMSDANAEATRCDFLEKNHGEFDSLEFVDRSGEWTLSYQAK